MERRTRRKVQQHTRHARLILSVYATTTRREGGREENKQSDNYGSAAAAAATNVVVVVGRRLLMCTCNFKAARRWQETAAAAAAAAATTGDNVNFLGPFDEASRPLAKCHAATTTTAHFRSLILSFVCASALPSFTRSVSFLF